MDQAQAAETAKDYAKAMGLYDRIVKGFEKADCAPAAKVRLDAIKGDPAIQAGIHGQEADRDCRSWLAMADNFQKAGATDKAREYLQKILDKYGDTPWAAKAKERLAALK
jgi:hypothetical protein